MLFSLTNSEVAIMMMGIFLVDVLLGYQLDLGMLISHLIPIQLVYSFYVLSNVTPYIAHPPLLPTLGYANAEELMSTISIIYQR